MGRKRDAAPAPSPLAPFSLHHWLHQGASGQMSLRLIPSSLVKTLCRNNTQHCTQVPGLKLLNVTIIDSTSGVRISFRMRPTSSSMSLVHGISRTSTFSQSLHQAQLKAQILHVRFQISNFISSYNCATMTGNRRSLFPN